MFEVDTLTVGAGGGAYPAAFHLARAGQRVVMIDPKGVMSGNCLAEGCVPSKAVREVAALLRRTQRGTPLGLRGEPPTAAYDAVVAHKDSVQELRYAQHAAELAALADRLRLVSGRATFLDPHTVEVDEGGRRERYRATNLILASGSDITVPPIPGAELCLTSRDLFALRPTLRQLPSSLVIVGGGYIGLEVAAIVRVFGVAVTVLEMMPQILPGMDPDFAALLASLLDPGIRLVLEARVQRIERTTDGVRVVYERAGRSERVEAEQALMAVGRHPVLPEGTAEIGIALQGGRPVVNAALQTSLPHIYAPGDVNGRSMLFHSAVRQSLVAAVNILNGNRPCDAMDFEAVPTAIFTFPEAAYVGLTRASARQRGLDVVEAAYAFAEDSRAQILDERGGELRLFFDPGSLRLLGGWVVGVDAANLIGEIGLAVSAGLTAHQLARFPDQHPMASEGIDKAARRLV